MHIHMDSESVDCAAGLVGGVSIDVFRLISHHENW